MQARSMTALLAVAALVVVALPVDSHAFLEKQEIKCSKALAKSVVKLSSSIAKTTAKCLDADIKGKKIQSCSPLPAKDAQKVSKAVQKVYKSVNKGCGSACSTALEISCIGDFLCPPRGNIGGRCSGKGGKKKFNYQNLGFPGFFCSEAGLLNGAEPKTADDLALCTSSIGSDIAASTIAQIYGSITNASAISEAAASCLKEMGKSVPKAIASVTKAIAKCRDKQNSLLNPTLNPAKCSSIDSKTAASIAKAEGKLSDSLAAKCSDAAVSELDLCGAGIGGTTTVTAAQSCLLNLVRQTVESDALPDDRSVVRATLINAAYPDSQVPVCGDNKVNQGPNPFLLRGEECDGSDDSACPGLCNPPGDAWQCTCQDRPRIWRYVISAKTNLDQGWTGQSHNINQSDQAGWIADISNCNCSAMTDAECTGVTTDPVCDETAALQPYCSGNVGGGVSCDAQGNGDGENLDADCYSCDANSVNAGTFCQGDADCQSQCFDIATMTPVLPQVLCNRQSDCGNGTVCLGRCDTSLECITTPLGMPLSLSAAGTSVCAVTHFESNLIGTTNIVTGEHELNYETRAVTHLGIQQSVPCPVCGGFCVGGSRDGLLCKGSCDVSGAPCRFDADCTAPGDTTCTSVSADCPTSVTSGETGYCNLELLCNSGPSQGKPCRISVDSKFGTTSADCLPDNNITGTGLPNLYFPSTSEFACHPSPMPPCTAPGFDNFDCPCPDDGGRKTQPNACNPACDAGPSFGLGCATGDGFGEFTVCVGGSEAGSACDEDADCSGGGTCSGNPTHCTNPGSKFQHSCSVDSDCDTSAGSGDGLCSDACPGGRCVPLCVPKGICSGGDRNGEPCGTDDQCTGGGTCGPDDPFDGVCASGLARTHCSGPGWDFISCTRGELGTTSSCEAGGDAILGTDDDNPGAGICIEDVRNCFLVDNLGRHGCAEGGDIFSGLPGAPTSFSTVAHWCITSTDADSANNTSGLGGPGRKREEGLIVPNFTSLP